MIIPQTFPNIKTFNKNPPLIMPLHQRFLTSPNQIGKSPLCTAFFHLAPLFKQ